MKTAAFILVVLGIVLLSIGNISSLIYGIYLWTSVDLSFKLALWGAVKLWLILVPVGIVSVIVGFILGD